MSIVYPLVFLAFIWRRVHDLGSWISSSFYGRVAMMPENKQINGTRARMESIRRELEESIEIRCCVRAATVKAIAEEIRKCRSTRRRSRT